MADKTTLVHKDKTPSEITTSNPTVITQLKSQGYAVKDSKSTANQAGSDADSAAGKRAGGSK